MSEIGDYHIIRGGLPAFIAPLIGNPGQDMLSGHGRTGHHPFYPNIQRTHDRKDLVRHTCKHRFFQIYSRLHDYKRSLKSRTLFPCPEILDDLRKNQSLHFLKQASVREYPAGHILPVQTTIPYKTVSQKKPQRVPQTRVLVVETLRPHVSVVDRNPKSGEHTYHIALAAAYTSCHCECTSHRAALSLSRSNNMQSTYRGVISQDITPSGLDTSSGTISESIVLTKSA